LLLNRNMVNWIIKISNNAGGYTRALEDDLKTSNTEVCPEKELLFSFKVS
jgi:hypothetical protein